MSKPGADGSMQDSLMGLWHLEQARTPISARRLNSELGWTDGMMLALDQAGALQNSQSPIDAVMGR